VASLTDRCKKIIHNRITVLLLVAAVAVCTVSAKQSTGSALAPAGLSKRVEVVANAVKTAPKGKASVATKNSFLPALSPKTVDTLKLVGLFAMWYAFNAGCKY